MGKIAESLLTHIFFYYSAFGWFKATEQTATNQFQNQVLQVLSTLNHKVCSSFITNNELQAKMFVFKWNDFRNRIMSKSYNKPNMSNDMLNAKFPSSEEIVASGMQIFDWHLT